MVDNTPTEESLTANNEQKIQSEEIIPVQNAEDVELSISSDNQETETVSEKKVNPLLRQKEQKKEIRNKKIKRTVKLIILIAITLILLFAWLLNILTKVK